MTPTTTQQQREVLFAEEQRLVAALSAVRTGLNDLTAIASLPTEILEEVFGVCVSWLYGHQKPKCRLAWTQVCRSWRRISLNSARLWRCIDLCDSRLAHEFLLRSKTAPISIISASPLKLCTDNLQSHAGRLQAIDVFLFPDDMVELFASIGSNLSNLTHMSLKIPPISANLLLDIDVTQVTRLMLDCVAIPWDTCRDLTHLSLRGLPTDYAPSILQLHAIFESSPQLEYVRLESIAPVIPDNPPLTRPVPLPHLRELIISGKPPLIRYILAGLGLPASARLQLHCSAFNDLHTLLPADHCWQRPEIGALRLSRRAANFLRAGAAPWTDDPMDSIISIGSSSSMSNTVLNSLNSISDLTWVTTLELSIGVMLEIQPILLMEFLTQTINLQSLRMASNNLEEVFIALTPRSSPSPSICICPHLANISFSMPGDVWWHFSEQWLQPLLALAKARHACSAALVTLEFDQCDGVSSDTAQLFTGLVPEIIIWEHVGTETSQRLIHS